MNNKNKNYYKKNNNYRQYYYKKEKKEKNIEEKKVTYESLINGDSLVSQDNHDISLTNNNRVLYVKYIGTLVILGIIILASLIFFHIL